MILILGGTSESLEIARGLDELGKAYILSVATDYGKEVATGIGGRVVSGRMDEEAMKAFIKENQIGLVIDSTHPFARIVSANGIAACQQIQIPYIRFERSKTVLTNDVILVSNIEQACDYANQYEGNVYLSTGSKELSLYLQYINVDRIVARVLPTKEVIESVLSLGLTPKQIHALQGPFKEALDRSLLEHVNAKVLITKDSGARGGVESKLAAAKSLGIPCIVIQREEIDYPRVIEDIDVLMEVVREREER